MRAWWRAVLVASLAVASVACGGHDMGFLDARGDGNSFADGSDGSSMSDGHGDGRNIDAMMDGGADGAMDASEDGRDATVPSDGPVVLPDGVTMVDGGWVQADGAPWYPPCPPAPDGGTGCAAMETCGNGLDDDCNGLADENCPCLPGAHERCYDGCSTQAGVGVCTWGVLTCTGSGEFGSYDGHCIGEGHPQPVVCGGERDYLCDGIIDEGCSCRAGETRACYTGPSGTRNVGACQDGVQNCIAVDGGTAWGPCNGEVLPSAPQCDGIDHACDGMPFEGCACMPGSTRSCYDGPAGTSGVGLCHDGTQTCILSGGNAAWGPCIGEVLPAPDTCDGVDRACNGSPDMGCGCTVGMMRTCYTGPAGTDGVGLCHSGTQSCVAGPTGGTWGACVGQVLPGPEVCDGLDHLCNGMPNTGCACPPGATRPCYDGPAGTDGVGACHDGMQSCITGPGGVGSSWGTCVGEVVPGPIACDGTDHACDGNYSADCPCFLGATRSCYDGPAGTAGVGTCAPGTQTCLARSGGGSVWGACVGEVLPSAPQCDGLDHACTGMLPNCAPMVACPAPVTTDVGTAISLRGTATAVAPSTIVSYSWSVISQPAGSTYNFSSTTTNPTTFSANNAGVYTIRLTVTDSMGRSSSCSVLVTVTARSYLGTEFWAVTTTNSELASGNTFQFAIAIGNPNSSAVTVTVTGGALTSPTVFTVPANSTVTQTLPWVSNLSHNSGMMSGTYTPSTSSLVANGAYRITTTAPVSAYQFNPLTFTTGGGRPTFSFTNDASLLLPTVALTSNYIALGHNSFAGGGSFVAIVGTSATPTTVTVQLASGITAGTGVAAAGAGTTQTYTLNLGDVVQLIATYPLPPGCGGTLPACTYQMSDLTGTVISATQPVAVFAGEDCSDISSPDGSCPACDHLEQQLFPTETWGRDVVVSQDRDRGNTTEPYVVRIMSRENSNTLTFTPAVHASVTLNRGQFIEFCDTRDFEVTSTQPILVGQFMVGQNETACGTCSTAAGTFPTVGDPSFTLEVPTPQYRHDYNFVVPSSYTASFINVVGQTGATILLDGTPLAGTGTAIAGTSWSVWRQSVAAGSHQINTAGPSGFGLKVIGVAPYTSYGYPGGLDLRTLP